MIKVGDKIKGFKADDCCFYGSGMDKFIGQIGIVYTIESSSFTIKFNDIPFHYPLNHPLAKPYRPFKNKLK